MRVFFHCTYRHCKHSGTRCHIQIPYREVVPGDHGENPQRPSVLKSEMPFPECRYTARTNLSRIFTGDFQEF